MSIKGDADHVCKAIQAISDNTEKGLPDLLYQASVRYFAGPSKEIVYAGHPDHLNRETGTIGKSITVVTTEIDGKPAATTGTDVVYARIHELGGVIAHPSGASIIIPPRPFLDPVFTANKDKAAELVKDGVIKLNREAT